MTSFPPQLSSRVEGCALVVDLFPAFLFRAREFMEIPHVLSA